MYLDEIPKALAHTFDVNIIGGRLALVDPEDRKARFLTTYTYRKLILNLAEQVDTINRRNGAFLPSMTYRVEVQTNRLGLPSMFFVTSVNPLNDLK